MIKGPLLLDADFFISYLTGDLLFEHSRQVVRLILGGTIKPHASSEVYDDIASALRSQGVSLEEVESFLRDVAAIPHRTIPVTAEVAAEALRIYREHGGPRRLHYFDSFHVALARQRGLPLLTSDRYILKNADRLGVRAVNLRKI